MHNESFKSSANDPRSACVIANVKPLLFALVGLVKGLDKIVVGVVVVVKGLLTGVLGALCGSVLDILF